jgi:hypothetical protein
MIYYYETTDSHGRLKAASDEEVKLLASKITNLVCLYKESDTPDGTPFIILLEN